MRVWIFLTLFFTSLVPPGEFGSRRVAVMGLRPVRGAGQAAAGTASGLRAPAPVGTHVFNPLEAAEEAGGEGGGQSRPVPGAPPLTPPCRVGPAPRPVPAPPAHKMAARAGKHLE